MKQKITAILCAAAIGAALTGCSCSLRINTTPTEQNTAQESGAKPQGAVTHDGVLPFGRVYLTGTDSVITTAFAANNGGIRFVSDQYKLSPLPAVVDEYDPYGFTIYNDRIYFLTGGASEVVPAQIYSCDTDGNDLQLIADDASNYSKCFIYNGRLYYDVYPASAYPYYSSDSGVKYDSGIWRISLDSGKREKLVDMKNVRLTYMDKEHLYYAVPDGDSCYYCDLNGKNEEMIFGTDERTYFRTDYEYIVDCNSDTVYRLRGSEISAAAINGIDEMPVINVQFNKSAYDSIVFYAATKDEIIYAVYYREGQNNYARLCGGKRLLH